MYNMIDTALTLSVAESLRRYASYVMK